MVEIKNTHVYNLNEALLASGNAMRLEPDSIKYLEGCDNITYKEDLEAAKTRCKKLIKNGGGSGHTNFRTGILVSFDLQYPQYFTKQLQRYHWIQYVSSTSMMHRITKMDFSTCCNKYVSESTKELMMVLITYYNYLCEPQTYDEAFTKYLSYIYLRFGKDAVEYIKSLQDRQDVIYDCYMRIISNCPMGAELWVHVTTNYEQLATIYKQRKTHKLKEDWGEFCNWIENLPESWLITDDLNKKSITEK